MEEPLISSVMGGMGTVPIAMNNKGDFIGSGGKGLSYFVYRNGSTGFQALPSGFLPTAISDAGDVVGMGANNLAALYSGGVIKELSTLIPEGSVSKPSDLGQPLAINNVGQILLFGQGDLGYEYRILTPSA